MNYKHLFFIGYLVILSSNTSAQSLYRQFKTPPNASRPRVWWHWMNGNISINGIQKDLLWMHRSGIGGFHNFDAGLFTPQVVEKRLSFMDPDWKKAFRFTTQLADSLGLEMAIAASPGWSESGGPWVPMKDGMKKLVWAELAIKGGTNYNGVLPKAPSVTGAFQNIGLAKEETAFMGETATPPSYYEDIAILAYKVPENDISIQELNPIVTSSGGNILLSKLIDNDLSSTQVLPSNSEKGYAWIQFEFQTPQSFSSISLVSGGVRNQWGNAAPENIRHLEVSEDGTHFKKVCDLPLGGVAQQTIAFAKTSGRFFRVIFDNPLPPFSIEPLLNPAATYPPAPKGTEIAEIVLHKTLRIHHAEEKAGFAATCDLTKYETPLSDEGINENDIIDVSKFLNQDGTFTWQAPAGNWKIIRFGFSLTGKFNHPASPEATGLEVDKLDGRAVKDYFENYLAQYKDATGGLIGEKGLQYLITDSYEAGQMTWTPLMIQEFNKRRGYNLIPWLPVLTGKIIRSTQASEQFLWDWRKTISELMIENHYDQLTTLLDKYGLKRYSESHENGRQFIGDGMDAKRTAAIPMSAMWTDGGTYKAIGSSIPMAMADIRESASVAHIYGQNLVAAESLTSVGFNGNAWSYSPETLKPTTDLELAMGLNRFVIHTSVHQPVDDKIPGLGLFIFGQWFNRHETWANQAKAWTDYLARSSYLLQQGKFVADILYYYGEDNNITALFGNKLPDIPKGYNYDFINPHALINLLSVKDGKLVTPSGMSYNLLYLDENVRKMSLPVLRKIATLVKEGAMIGGAKPVLKAGLLDDQKEFDSLVNEIWGSKKSNVKSGKSILQILKERNIQPDFEYFASKNDTELLFVHRKIETGDIYWVNNRHNRNEKLKVICRVTGKLPKLWHPETGKTEDVSYSIENGRTSVSLNLTPNDAVFIVFNSPVVKTTVALPLVKEATIATLSGAWNVSFQPNRGAPATAVFNKLTSFTENSDEGIKYFSGTATYTQSFKIQGKDLKKNQSFWLDLGEVKNIAEVILNGKNIGIAWKKPYVLDITDSIQKDENTLEIRVTNLWVNRIIGDMQPNVTNKITYTTLPFYKANSPLLTSGLLGTVKVIAKE